MQRLFSINYVPIMFRFCALFSPLSDLWSPNTFVQLFVTSSEQRDYYGMAVFTLRYGAGSSN